MLIYRKIKKLDLLILLLFFFFIVLSKLFSLGEMCFCLNEIYLDVWIYPANYFTLYYNFISAVGGATLVRPNVVNFLLK